MFFAELPRSFGKFVEVAAEARPGDFADIKSLRSERVCVYQVGGLIVSYNPDIEALFLEHFGQATDGGRFACAQEAANHDEPHRLFLAG